MRNRYRMYQRNGGMFYAKDRKTGQAISLATADEREATRLLAAKNQATEQPCLNVAMAKVYLSAQSPEFLSRTWSQLIALVAQGYQGATAIRWRKFASSAPLKILVNLPLYQTEAVHIIGLRLHCGLVRRNSFDRIKDPIGKQLHLVTTSGALHLPFRLGCYSP
jgi:hypothetical protein